MNNIESIIGLLLAFVAAPDACRRLERPALVSAAFVANRQGSGLVVADGIANDRICHRLATDLRGRGRSEFTSIAAQSNGGESKAWIERRVPQKYGKRRECV